MYLEIFLADFAVFRVFWEFRWISRKYLNFAGPRPRDISEALLTCVFCPECAILISHEMPCGLCDGWDLE